MSTARTRIRMTGWRAVAVWLVAVSGILSIIVSQVANPADLIVVLIIGEVVVSFGVVGAIVVTHLPDNRVGWLLWGSGAVLGWATAGTAYATHSAVSCGGCLPATVPIAVLANVGFGPVVGVVGVVIPLLFPNGRLASRRWLPVAWLGIVATVLFTASIAVTPGPMSGGIENPIGVDLPGGQERHHPDRFAGLPVRRARARAGVRRLALSSRWCRRASAASVVRVCRAAHDCRAGVRHRRTMG